MIERELLITVQDQSVIRAEAPGQRTVFGELMLPPLHRDMIHLFENWLGMDKITREEEIKMLGSLLFGALFSGDVNNLLNELRRGTTQDNRLRVELSFQGKAFDIAGFPWEFLFVPESETSAGYYLATDARLVLSRYMPHNTERQAGLKPTKEALRILVVVSSPIDLDMVVAPPVIDTIQNLAKEQAVEVVVEQKPTVDALQKHLETFQPHVLHYLGHSRFNQSRLQGEIALLSDDTKTARWVPDTPFTEFIRQLKVVPRLVFLHSCEGGANEMTARFAGLAPQLIRADVQAVVAMQYPITNKAAIQFSQAFYAELSRGAPVDNAVQSGRLALVLNPEYTYANRVFGTPMLWMRSRTGMVMPKEKG